MRRRVPQLLAAALVAVSLVAGCGGGDESEAVATTDVVMAKSYRFEPGKIEVEAGAAVTFRNDDNFTHTVKVDGEDKEYRAEPGEGFAIRFAEPGTYHYVCTLHPHDMDGEVIVE